LQDFEKVVGKKGAKMAVLRNCCCCFPLRRGTVTLGVMGFVSLI